MSGPAEGLRWVTVQLGELPEEPVRWLWLRHVLEGVLHLVEGEEGVGKGYFSIWAAVQVASGSWYGEPRSVVWFSSEERATWLQSRLLVAGYKPGVHAPVYMVGLNKGLLSLPLYEPQLIAKLRKFQPSIGLVIVDPLRDHCAPTDEMGVRFKSNNDETWIRPACQSWQRVAETLTAAFFGLQHRNKSSEGTARQKSTGSGAWRQVCRHVLTLARVRDQRALAVDKSNLGIEDKEPFSYEIEAVPIGTDDQGQPITQGRFVLGGRTGHEDINDWEKATAKNAEIDMTEIAEVWLEEHLQPGEFFTKQFVQTGLGISETKAATLLKKLRTEGFLLYQNGRGYGLNGIHS